MRELVGQYARPEDLVQKRGPNAPGSSGEDAESDDDDDMGADDYISSDEEGPDMDV